MQFHVSTKRFSCTLGSEVHTANFKIRPCVSSRRLQKEEWKIVKLSSPKMVAVAYERWSLTRGSNFKNLTGKILGFSIKIFRSSERVIEGLLWEVVAYQR